jgi:hypothetical protein
LGSNVRHNELAICDAVLNMIRQHRVVARILTSLWFLAGGVGFWFLLALLHGFAESQAGMSAGAFSGPPSSEAMIPWLVCLYFAIGAVAPVAFKNKSALKGLALAAHAVLLIAVLILCSEASGIGQALLVTLIAVAAFFPWWITWCVLIFSPRG